MPYKDKEVGRRKALERYYSKREEILKYQDQRLRKKYATDPIFRAKRQLRDKSRMSGGDMTNLFNEECSECGSKIDLHRHHPDYTSTNFIILCRGCHNTTHQNLNSGKSALKQIT
jgi:hypothetical protein